MADDDIPEEGAGEAPATNVIEMAKAAKVVRKKKEKAEDTSGEEKRDKRGVNQFAVNTADVVKALETWEELAGLVYYDTFSGRLMKNRMIPGDCIGEEDLPVKWEDHDTLLLVTHMNRWIKKLGKHLLLDAVMVVAVKNSRSSAQIFFNGLDKWDGVERLDWFFVNVCGIDPTNPQFEYVKRVTRAFFISIMARVYKPGCQVDTVLILEGKQGIFKSSLLREIAMVDRWFSNKMPHRLDDVDTKDHLKGKLVIELSELVQMRARDAEEMKNFLSICEDEHRSKWGTMPGFFKRQCVFVGSTNEKNYLKDETGNRRYWPIDCGDKDIDLAQAKKILPQVYAEAMVALEAREPWWFASDDPMMLMQQEERKVDNDPWHDDVVGYVENKRMGAKLAHYAQFDTTIGDILTFVIRLEKAKQTRRELDRVSGILKKLGGIKKNKSIGKTSVNVYLFDV